MTIFVNPGLKWKETVSHSGTYKSGNTLKGENGILKANKKYKILWVHNHSYWIQKKKPCCSTLVGINSLFSKWIKRREKKSSMGPLLTAF